MRLHTALGKWILHTRHTKTCTPSSSLIVPKPWSHHWQTQREKLSVCTGVHIYGHFRLLEMLRQSSIWNSNCQCKYLESIGHIKQKMETRGRGRQELRDLENKRRFKGKTEERRSDGGREKRRERKSGLEGRRVRTEDLCHCCSTLQ